MFLTHFPFSHGSFCPFVGYFVYKTWDVVVILLFFARISCVFKHFLGDLLAFFFIFWGDFFHFFTTKISFWY